MSLFKKMQSMFSSKRKKKKSQKEDMEKEDSIEEEFEEEADDDEEVPLNREDLRELEKIIRASKEAFYESMKNRNKNYRDVSQRIDANYCFGDMEDFQAINDEELDFLESGSRNASSNGGIAFEVDFEPAKKVKAKPKEKKHKEVEPMKPLMEYSIDEKALMAEIIRDDMLSKRAHKAAQTDIKRYDASRRRMVMAADAEARAAERQNEGLSPLDETNMRLKKLALKAKEARLKAAKRH